MSTIKFDTWKSSDGVREYAPVHTHVRFNGQGTIAILGTSLNVTSLTDNGTGSYSVNFTTALANVNYTLLGTAGGVTTNQFVVSQNNTPLTTSVPFETSIQNAATADALRVSIAIVGGI